MLKSIIPRLPARDLEATKRFYTEQLDFEVTGEYENYLLLSKDQGEVHFYFAPDTVPERSDCMMYLRVETGIEALYESYRQRAIPFAQLSHLEQKPWGQLEFAILDVNGTLLTFGQAVK